MAVRRGWHLWPGATKQVFPLPPFKHVRFTQILMFNDPLSWQTEIENIGSKRSHWTDNDKLVRPPTFLITGAKNAGKSSFARALLLCDLLLRYTRVAYLECDPGQTEFTPPGLLSLHLIDKPIIGSSIMFQIGFID